MTGVAVRSLPRRTASVLGWVVAALLLAFVAWQLLTRWDDLASQVQTIQIPLLALAVVGLGGHLMITAALWRRLLGGLGSHVGYGEAFRIIYLSNLAKYLPGGAWSVLGRAVLCDRAGIPRVTTTAIIVLDLACQVAAGLIVALVAFSTFGWAGNRFDPPVVLLGIAGILALVHPKALNTAIRAVSAISGRHLAPIEVPYSFLLGMLLLYVANWSLLAASFVLLSLAFVPFPVDLPHAALLAGSFTLAWNVGVVAFVIPGGLGVREAALLVLLTPAIAEPWPAVLGIVARFWLASAETVAFLVALAVTRLRSARRGTESAPT
jgi:glycosyltransferase 2 family protein